MTNITLAVPEDVKKEMEKFPEINWSAIAREAIKKRIILLRKFREFTKNSEFTEEDAIRIGKEVNKRVSRKLKDETRN